MVDDTKVTVTTTREKAKMKEPPKSREQRPEEKLKALNLPLLKSENNIMYDLHRN